MTPNGDDKLSVVVSNLDHWSTSWNNLTGTPEWDSPVVVGSRIWFRRGYPHPDWSAFGIDISAGVATVLRLTTERRSAPLTSVVATFTDLGDAGKYVIATVADFLRTNSGLDPIHWEWKRLGVDDRIDITSASDEDIAAMTSMPDVDNAIPSAYLKRYVVTSRPTQFACLSDGKAAMSRVMLLDFGEVNSIFGRGMI
ncbi:hypothetical protein [Mycolicibacterium mengxianglii]|nr:hypothetical protein [Mycolicibacterium mengxianglii]